MTSADREPIIDSPIGDHEDIALVGLPVRHRAIANVALVRLEPMLREVDGYVNLGPSKRGLHTK